MAFLILGAVSLFWLIARSGTKPSRLNYPCQQIAASNGAIFVTWLVSVFSLHFLFRKTKKAIVLLILIAFGVYAYKAFSIKLVDNQALSAGTSKVVQVTDSSATNSWGSNNYSSRADQTKVNNMMNNGILALTGQTTIASAWSTIFKNHNGGADYQNGEIIAIKLNFNNTINSSMAANDNNPLPQTVNALLRQLIVEKGIPANNIILYDTTRSFPAAFNSAIAYGVQLDPDYSLCTAPWSGAPQITCLLGSAKYLINIPLLRTHSSAGVTLSFKNHFGSTNNPGFFHPSDTVNDANMVRFYSDSRIAGKTILIVDDALYSQTSGGPDGAPDRKSNSIFLSTDPVAIDSVMIDYMQKNSYSIYQVSSDPRNYLKIAANTYSLGNFSTSCTSGTNCSFSYSNIDYVLCSPNCPNVTITPTPTPKTGIKDLRTAITSWVSLFNYNSIVAKFGF